MNLTNVSVYMAEARDTYEVSITVTVMADSPTEALVAVVDTMGAAAIEAT